MTKEQLEKRIKFEYKHHMAVITNPTPDVTKRDKEKARIITSFLQENFYDVIRS